MFESVISNSQFSCLSFLFPHPLTNPLVALEASSFHEKRSPLVLQRKTQLSGTTETYNGDLQNSEDVRAVVEKCATGHLNEWEPRSNWKKEIRSGSILVCSEEKLENDTWLDDRNWSKKGLNHQIGGCNYEEVDRENRPIKNALMKTIIRQFEWKQGKYFRVVYYRSKQTSTWGQPVTVLRMTPQRTPCSTSDNLPTQQLSTVRQLAMPASQPLKPRAHISATPHTCTCCPSWMYVDDRYAVRPLQEELSSSNNDVLALQSGPTPNVGRPLQLRPHPTSGPSSSGESPHFSVLTPSECHKTKRQRHRTNTPHEPFQKSWTTEDEKQPVEQRGKGDHWPTSAKSRGRTPESCRQHHKEIRLGGQRKRIKKDPSGIRIWKGHLLKKADVDAILDEYESEYLPQWVPNGNWEDDFGSGIVLVWPEKEGLRRWADGRSWSQAKGPDPATGGVKYEELHPREGSRSTLIKTVIRGGESTKRKRYKLVYYRLE